MHITPRSYLTSGIAVLGVGAIALAPIQPLPDHTAAAQDKAVASLAVNLAATIDPITPWVNTFKTSVANIQTLGTFKEQNPFPLLKTIGANIGTYAKELGSGQAGLIPEQIWNNIQTFFKAPWDPGAGVEIPYTNDPTFLAIGEYASGTTPADGSNSPSTLGYLPAQLVVGQFANGCEADDTCTLKSLIPIVNFLNTPYSGQLIGAVGPLISPFVQLVKSFTAIGQYFQQGKALEAINELINIPANMTNAFLNGAGFLDLTGIVKAVAPGVAGEIGLLGVNLGGLLNAMPQNGSLAHPDDPPTAWAGGIGLDSLVLGIEPAPAAPGFGGIPNGLFGANIGLGQFLAEKLLVTAPAPAQALTPAAAVKAAAATAPVVVNATAPVEAPAVVNAPAPVEAAPAPAPVSAPAPVAVPKVEVAAPAPEPVSTPAPSRARAAASAGTGNSSAAQHDSSDSTPAKHRGSRGQ